jgi:hypothetical protein
MFGMHHSVAHHVIYVVYHLLQAQFFQQHFVAQNSQAHSLTEVSGTQHAGGEGVILIMTEASATNLIHKAQENKTSIMQNNAVKPVQ